MKEAIVFFVIGMGEGIIVRDWMVEKKFNRESVKAQVLGKAKK